MDTQTFTILFVSFVILTMLLRFWLAARQLRHVLGNRGAVPAEFAAKIPLDAHQKAADYTAAQTRFGLLSLAYSSTILIAFTLLGGLQWLSITVLGLTGEGMAFQLALLVSFAVIATLVDLPFDYYHQFVLEERFGFNKMGKGLWLLDLAKNIGLSVVLGLPLAWVVLTLMAQAGALWWFYAWAFIVAYQLLMMVIAPTWIMPLFNKFTPLEDDSLKTRIEGLMGRVGFRSKGLFVMDGSKRSGHGNAYFSGFGGNKRIVFFDTLIERLAPSEIEAVLAHELGHFKLKHIAKRLAVMFSTMLAFLALLGYLKEQLWFYEGLGVNALFASDAVALILFMLVLPVFTFMFAPLTSISSRKHEFEADAFAATHTDANDLVSALVKLYEDNASTLTPDPVHSAFYDSHPPASVRIRQLKLAAQ
jgi:STE24 endopeptidase